MGTFVKVIHFHQQIPRSFTASSHNLPLLIVKMKFSTIFALVGAAVASPVIEERQNTIDPLSASLAVFNALPTSLREMALTNPGAVVSAIASDFATGTPTWFQAIPTDVQSYFLSQADDLGVTDVPSAGASATGALSSATGSAASEASGAASSAAGALSSAGASASAALSSAAGGLSSLASSASAAASSATSDSGAMPTQVIAGGFAGVAGLMAVLAL